MEPSLTFYNTLEEMFLDVELQPMPEGIPEPPVRIEHISGTSDLLLYISYIKEHSLFQYNQVYKYLVRAEEPIIELDRMIGMRRIKETITTQIIYYAKKLSKNNGVLDSDTVVYLNTAIYGPPGSGKTTIARIIGKLYHKLGVVETDKFVVGRRDTMIGKYLGQTAPATRKVIESAENGVLFLDEVYQFGSSADGNRDSYAKELVDTINQYITDNPGKVIFIVAGYRDEVKSCFFAQNQGLERRFRWSYTIEPYLPYELLKIFYKQAQESRYAIVAKMLELPSDESSTCTSLTALPVGKKKQCLKKLNSTGISFFTEHIEHFKYGGGDTETFLDRCKMVNEKRTITAVDDEGRINDVDVTLGFEEYLEYVKDRTTKSSSNKSPPPGMYV